jgi:signal transduction histidine kinase
MCGTRRSALSAFFGVLPFAHVQLAKIEAFIPIVASVMFLTDSITAMLLFAQFSVTRSRAHLVLANGYLFTALIVIPYALTFPGAFTPNGLLGAGLQSAGWLFVIWHLGLPISVIAYVLLDRAPPEIQQTRTPVSLTMLASVTAMIAVVGLLTWFVTAYNDYLPVLVLNLAAVSGLKPVTLTVLSLSVIAIILLWIWRRSVLDLWLLVVSLAWLLDSIFMNLTESRYTVVWYANRVLGISAASFVLFVLLAESMMLYARLALSVLAQRREREGRLLSMDAMSAAIAHEIRQPLGAIVAHANAGQRWLERTPPELDEATSSFKDIAAAGHRAGEVMQSVRAMFAKGEQSRTPLDTNDLVTESIALVRPELEASGIIVQLDLAERLPVLTANRGQLQQVVLNLVNNAADAMRSNGHQVRLLRVKSESADSGGVAISIEDTGTGVDPKNMDRIFEAFFTTKPNGMGMGLAICRSIIESHGGRLSVSSGTPHGSVFQIVLPGGQ